MRKVVEELKGSRRASSHYMNKDEKVFIKHIEASEDFVGTRVK